MIVNHDNFHQVCTELQRRLASDWANVLIKANVAGERKLSLMLEQLKASSVHEKLNSSQLQTVRTMLERTRAECDELYCERYIILPQNCHNVTQKCIPGATPRVTQRASGECTNGLVFCPTRLPVQCAPDVSQRSPVYSVTAFFAVHASKCSIARAARGNMRCN